MQINAIIFFTECSCNPAAHIIERTLHISLTCPKHFLFKNMETFVQFVCCRRNNKIMVKSTVSSAQSIKTSKIRLWQLNYKLTYSKLKF